MMVGQWKDKEWTLLRIDIVKVEVHTGLVDLVIFLFLVENSRDPDAGEWGVLNVGHFEDQIWFAIYVGYYCQVSKADPENSVLWTGNLCHKGT